MISERMLRKWRKEALHIKANASSSNKDFNYQLNIKQAELILKMTQILLDQHLLNKDKS